MDLEQVARELRQRLDALGPAPRAELLRVLPLPDFDRADRIGKFWGYPEARTFAELLIDCEEKGTLRAVLRRDAPGGRPGFVPVAGRTAMPRRTASRQSTPDSRRADPKTGPSCYRLSYRGSSSFLTST